MKQLITATAMFSLWLQQQRDPRFCSCRGPQVKLAVALKVTRFFIVMMSSSVLINSADFYPSANQLNAPS